MSVFGSTYFAVVQNKKKLDPRSEQGIFVGYDESPRIVFISRNLIQSGK